ncbi:hypothetical protein B0H66DRAFT_624266 [Apodospora peruviana]|uniref:Zn(2)-C6 fungal-type domain-containing protein n=1 Tax=Apodospora peruviana TaxID=516989 RepID=A0AAE0I6V4_9PEZI|nr:hypothetical protein B0H66DRAFT_624266 [Apodospora peruviana]
MFGTWRVTPGGSDPTILGPKPNEQKACDSCRTKKLSGGCQRCESLRIVCTFLADTTKKKGATFVVNQQPEGSKKETAAAQSVRSYFQTLSPPPLGKRLASDALMDNNNRIELLERDQDDDEGADDIFLRFTESDSWDVSFSSTAGSSPYTPAPTDVDYDDEIDDKFNLLSSSSIHGGGGGLDSALDIHKQALLHGESIRLCQYCSSVRAEENAVLLLLLANRLVSLCSYMVTSLTTATCDAMACSSGHQSPIFPCEELFPLDIAVGGYRVDYGLEQAVVLRELVAFQLSPAVFVCQHFRGS